MSSNYRALLDRAAQHYGVVGPEDLQAVGVTGRQANTACQRGFLEASGFTTFRVTGSPPVWEQRLYIAMVECGPAVVSHSSAAALHGFDGFPKKPIEILTINDGGWTAAGVIRHRTRRLDGPDCSIVGVFAVTSAARTIIDLSGYTSKAELERAVDSANRDRLCSEEYLRRRLFALRSRGRRGVRLLDQVLDGRGGVRFDSELERAFGDLAVRAGLPRPLTQIVRRVDGRVFRIDFFFVDANLMVEVSGHRTHSTREARAGDAKRHRALTQSGARWIEFTGDEVFFDPDGVITELRAHLTFAIAS